MLDCDIMGWSVDHPRGSATPFTPVENLQTMVQEIHCTQHRIIYFKAYLG